MYEKKVKKFKCVLKNVEGFDPNCQIFNLKETPTKNFLDYQNIKSTLSSMVEDTNKLKKNSYYRIRLDVFCFKKWSDDGEIELKTIKNDEVYETFKLLSRVKTTVYPTKINMFLAQANIDATAKTTSENKKKHKCKINVLKNVETNCEIYKFTSDITEIKNIDFANITLVTEATEIKTNNSYFVIKFETPVDIYKFSENSLNTTLITLISNNNVSFKNVLNLSGNVSQDKSNNYVFIHKNLSFLTT